MELGKDSDQNTLEKFEYVKPLLLLLLLLLFADTIIGNMRYLYISIYVYISIYIYIYAFKSHGF